MRTLRELRDRTEAATMVEYAIMAAFIAAVCIGIVGIVGVDVRALFARLPAF